MIAALAAAAVFGTASGPSPVPSLQLYVLTGQSNMVGYALPVPARRPHPRVFQVSDGRPRPLTEPLVLGAGAGPAVSFANELVRRDSRARIGIIMCAESGSQAQLWQPGGRLYEECLREVRAAAPLGHVRAVLHFQGESDTGDDANVDAWPVRFADFAGARFGLRVPLLFAQIADWPQRWGATLSADAERRWTRLRALQAAARPWCSRLVRTSGIPYGVPDAQGAHFSVAGYREVGRRFAAAARGLRCR